MGEGSPKNDGLHPQLQPPLCLTSFHSPLSRSFWTVPFPRPYPSAFSGLHGSVFNISLLAPACSSLSLLSQENPVLVPLATSLFPLSSKFLKKENLCLMSSLLYLCFLLDLPILGLFFKVCPQSSKCVLTIFMTPHPTAILSTLQD